MTQAPRRKFLRVADWYEFLNEQRPQPLTGADLRELRKLCYKEIEGLRKRPLLVYATRFPGAAPQAPISIDLSDIEGFTDLVTAVGETKEVDILIHSPGGSADAAERIVGLLRPRFDKVCFLVPHSAYSAATMLSLSGDEVILHPSATLGPIDPQVNGIPARSIKRGFERVRDMLKQQGPEALPAYIPLLEKYSGVHPVRWTPG